MFSRIVKYLKYRKLKNENEKNTEDSIEKKENIAKSIDMVKKRLQESFSDCDDFVAREISCGEQHTRMIVAFIDGQVEREILNRDVIHPIMTAQVGKCTIERLLHSIINNFEVNEITKYHDAVENILYSGTIIFMDGSSTALNLTLKSSNGRKVTEPDIEAVVRGPREGFVESIHINVSLVRKKIRDTNLKMEIMRLGKRTKTEIAVMYIKEVARDDIIEEVRKRLGNINTDAILESGYVEQFIEDNPLSPIATIANSQKPDIIAAKILEGRVAIFVDGTPHVLTVPHLFIETIQTSEDYYSRPFGSTFLRVLRIVALMISIFMPGMYVALQTFHQEMIPTILLMTMAGSREGVPFPSIIESFIMVIAFDLIHESGIRLPRPIGSAISIVGALILGTAAVDAGIVGAPMVIIVAVTGVATFVVPALTEAITIYRYFFLILGGFAGLYSITAGIFIVLVQAVSLTSFGVPFMTSVAPFRLSGVTDYIFRFPLWSMKRRPDILTARNKVRQGNTRGDKA